MLDEPFYRKTDERIEDWHARLATMDPVHLSCHLRARRKIWQDMAQQALRKQGRTKKASPRQSGASTSAGNTAGPNRSVQGD
jgi:hypothetical protein